MATSMEADSKVLCKKKREEKGVKAETAVDDATLRFDFRLSTLATPPQGRGAEPRGGDGEEQRRVELKKFSLRPEKYYEKGDFEGWVNQFEEYATLGQWNEEEKASLLFLSLTAGARMYFVGLPEREKMVYATRGEALCRRFGQETDTSIALQELAGLRRGKNQSAKELADSARRLASRAYHSNDYASQEKAKLSDLGNGGENRRDPGTIYKKSSPGSQAGGVRAGSVLEDHGREARGPGGRDQGRSGAEKTVGGTPGNGPATEGRHGMSLVPSKRTLHKGVPDQRY